MNDIKEVAQNTKTVWESFKKVCILLKDGKFFAAFRESFGFLKLIYKNYLKNKYITVKGKQIPRTLAAIIALFLVYLAFPSCEQKTSTEPSINEVADTKKETNTYDKNGLKVYELRKCEEEGSAGVCGLIENYGENNFLHVKVTLTFYSAEGHIAYEGGVEASDVESHTRSKINVPCPEEFAYFKLKSVETDGMTSAE